MAQTVGSLVALLGLDSSAYTRGLTRAEKSAQDFARKTRSAILDVGAALGGLAIGQQFIQATKDIIAEASALNDLSDATGSSVEALSRLNNQAKIAGTDFKELETAVLRLSAGMAGTDAQSTKAKEALKALGITTKDPVEALQQMAVKLNTYADGVNKTGLAQAAFGRDGARYAALLKDIAELQGVNATVTKKQADEAENLEKAYRRLGVEAEGYKNILLSSLVPAMNTFMQTMNDARRVAGTFGQGLEATFSLMARSGSDADQLAKVTSEIERLKKSFSTDLGPLKGLTELREFIGGEQLTDLQNQKAVLEQRLRRANQARIREDVAGVFGPKPDAPFVAADAKKTKAIKDQVSEAARLLDTMEKQYQATLDLNAVDTARAAIFELLQNKKSGLTPDFEADILDFAKQIDFARASKKVQEDLQRTAEETARIRATNSQSLTREIEGAQREAQAIRDQNQALEDNVVFIRGGEDAVRALTDARLADAIAASKQREASLLNADADQRMIASVQELTAALERQRAIIGNTRVAEQMAAEAKVLDAAMSQAFDHAGDALLDFINGTKSGKDAFKSFADSVTRDLQRIALSGIKDSLLGNKSGPNLFDLLPKLLGLFGSGGTGGVPGVGFSGGGFGEHFAMGGVSSGGLALVGERGPELVDLPTGARVIPNHRLAAANRKEFHMPITVNVLPGATTASGKQAASLLRDAVLGAIREH